MPMNIMGTWLEQDDVERNRAWTLRLFQPMLHQELFIVQNVFCFSIRDDMTVVYDNDTREEFLDHRHIVRRNQHCDGKFAQ